MNVFERLYFEQPGGMFRELNGLMTLFTPKDPSLYRKLLPKTFDLPPKPAVVIFVADYTQVVTWPVSHFRYQEWAVLLKCLWNGEEGLHCVTMAVSSWLAVPGGKHLGFPKYVAQSISLTGDEKTHTAVSRYKDVEQLRLEFQPKITRPLSPWEKELLDKDSFFKGKVFLLVPPARGPRTQKVDFHHVIQPKWSPERGMVRVKVNPGESWSGLVPESAVFPGEFNHFIGGANLTPELNT